MTTQCNRDIFMNITVMTVGKESHNVTTNCKWHLENCIHFEREDKTILLERFWNSHPRVSAHAQVGVTIVHVFEITIFYWWLVHEISLNASISERVFINSREELRLADHNKKGLHSIWIFEGVGWWLGRHICPRHSYWFIGDVMTRRSWS